MSETGHIILIGMPGSGKSTTGLLLARSICRDFIDTDLLIQRQARATLQKIINESGMQNFLALEERILLNLNDIERPTIIATGGSAVLSEQAMKHLRKLGKVVWLDVSVSELKKRLKNIKSRGIAMASDQTLDDLLKARLPLYNKYADIRISTEHNNIEQTIEQLITALGLDKCET